MTVRGTSPPTAAGAPLVTVPTPRRGPLPILRPKGHLSPAAVRGLMIAASLPLASILVRSLGDPFLSGPLFDVARDLGATLDRLLSLNDIPFEQRDHVLYLLLLPTCALLVALARLTFGIRVLGFRSILIAVGFHQSGIVPSLMLIAFAVATIVLVRPWLRRIQLPYYARVSVILCIVATTMVGGLLVGPWMRSDLVWGAAYFPVIVLGMLAEGIARTLDRDNAVSAAWRAMTTILLAFLIALVCWVPALRSLLLQFPELVLSQIVAIVLISEFLDLRLLQDWDRRVADRWMARKTSNEGGIRVAVVRNRPETGGAAPPGRGRPRLAPRSLRAIVAALRSCGYHVRVFEGDTTLLPALRRFLPAAPDTRSGGIVFNLAHGARGAADPLQVPAVLEMAGIPYVGPTAYGHLVAADLLLTRTLLREAGIPTPATRLARDPGDTAGDLAYPVVVRSRDESGGEPRVARDPQRLAAAVRRAARSGKGALIEERISGRRISVSVLGNTRPRCLPLVERRPAPGGKICPALLDEVVARRIEDHAVMAFRACGCRDYARVDLCLGESGEIHVLGVATLGVLARHGAFAIAGAAAGRSYRQLLTHIVETARRREFGGPRPRIGRRRRTSAAGSEAMSASVEIPAT